MKNNEKHATLEELVILLTTRRVNFRATARLLTVEIFYGTFHSTLCCRGECIRDVSAFVFLVFFEERLCCHKLLSAA